MALEFKSGGRSVSLDQFMENIKRQAIAKAMDHIAEKLHGKAASLVDPETGKQPVVIIRPVGDIRLILRTSGSPAYALELERRMGLRKGEVTSMTEAPGKKRLVYLAHASEDKEVARPIAEGLMKRGVDVWFDQWEIRTGDSLIQKMEAGLSDCTHFVVLLTPISLQKAWVREEIEAGLTAHVDGVAKFMGLRINLPLANLTPFLRNRLCPEITPGEAALEDLVADILNVSLKPSFGPLPKYVRKDRPASLRWSDSSLSLAEYFCRNSQHGAKFDPQSNLRIISELIGLPLDDLKIGALDLSQAGLVEMSKSFARGDIYPLPSLFTEMDQFFMDWDPEHDAKTLATFIHNTGAEQAVTQKLGADIGWPARRMNPAVNYLVEARIVEAHDSIGRGPYGPAMLTVGVELLRFIRNMG